MFSLDYRNRNPFQNIMTQDMTVTILTNHKRKLPVTTLKPGIDGIVRAIWQELTAFQDWPKWMPATKEVIRIDDGLLGRGSTLQVTGRSSIKIWSISLWDPPRRVEFIIGSTSRHHAHLAYGFSLLPDNEHKELSIVLDVEYMPLGFRRLMIPLFRWMQYRKGEKLLNRFVKNLQGSS